MKLAGDAPRVLLDASPFFSFAAAGWKALAALGRFLGERGSITAEVDFELRRNSQAVRELSNLSRLGWPQPPPLQLPPPRRQELLDIKRAQSGGHPREDLGEISTVLMAQELGETVVVIDDRLGRQLCRFRKVSRLSTAQLAAEMVARDALTVELGDKVFQRATPAGLPKTAFRAEVRKVQAATS